jgi:diguanylate cyclase (GGDEF)-like protein
MHLTSDTFHVVLLLALGVFAARLTLDNARLRRLAATDDLTGLHNLRSFESRLALMVRAAYDERTPLSMLVLDVDRLKSLNDRHGHLTGAEAVRSIGRIIASRLPADAVACRYGGDEFAIAIPECTPFRMRRIADDLRYAVHQSVPTLAGQAFAQGTLSISVGGATASLGRDVPRRRTGEDADTGEWLFRAADAALYHAKALGRNQVWVA